MTTQTIYPGGGIQTAEASAANFGLNVGELIEEKLETAPRRVGSMEFECNVGRTEQKIRIAAGTALLAAAAFAPISRGWRIGLSILGVAQIVTGATRHCPVSRLLGVNTCSRGQR